ncbi:MAG: glycosyltransferase [Lachnospiraceae bacterium]|nr:glycosyltransferase [Lachnospiraceae bacterium]
MVNNKPLVSIIVPVFNVEKYLPKCIESLLRQTYTNLEIILSDDGSTDESSLICDRYAVYDSRIKVIHKENGGLSDARNAGLGILTGEYVTFVDSDDYLEKDAIEILAMTAIEHRIPIVHMNSYIVSYDYKIIENQSSGTRKVSICTSEEYIQGMCEKRKSESVCDKLFKAELFHERRFEKGRLNEDFFFLSKMLFTDLKIAEIDYSGYNYYQRSGSITNSGYGKSLVDSVKNAYELKELAHIENPKLEKYFARLTLFQARTLFIVIPWKNVKEDKTDYIDSFHYLRKSISFIKEVNLSKQDKLIVQSIDKFPKQTIWLLGKIWKIKRG